MILQDYVIESLSNFMDARQSRYIILKILVDIGTVAVEM